MRTIPKLIAPAGILAVAWLFNASIGSAKPEYTRKTKKECEYCHPPNNRELNEAGKYYRDHNYTLDGYKPKDEKRAASK